MEFAQCPSSYHTQNMDQSHLYRQIVDSIRDDILSGVIKPVRLLPQFAQSRSSALTHPLARAGG
jgi:DNA-binding transcriptional MocR family regulator